MTIMKVRRRRARKQQAVASCPSQPTRPQPIVTWAETAECTCPDRCDRDHEQD